MTYDTAYDAFLDGCVAAFTKAYGPFFLENRMNEANLYAKTTGGSIRSLTLNLGLRYEYVSAPKEIARTASTMDSAPTPTTSSRASAPPGRAGDGWLAGLG